MSKQKNVSVVDPETEKIERYKTKLLVKKLNSMRGCGTSVITLIIPPGDQISRYNAKLTEEYGASSNIKSRVNRQSVQDAITSTQQKLKLYNRVPNNGLILYCGNVILEDGKEKRLAIDIEPFKPINRSLYMCDNKFHTDIFDGMFEDENRYGFVVMDGNGVLLGSLQGNVKNTIARQTIELPKKHNKGGQSSVRFARLGEEARNNYVRKASEMMRDSFISNDKVDYVGIIIAGSGGCKNRLMRSDLLDKRIRDKIIKIIDIQYGGDHGFNEAIEASQDSLGNVKFLMEKKVISDYMTNINIDVGRCAIGVKDTMRKVMMGVVERMIIFCDIDVKVVSYIDNDIECFEYFMDKDYINSKRYKDIATTYKNLQTFDLFEWILDNYKTFGCTLEIVTDNTPEGSQFVKGFGGIGGVLRYHMDDYVDEEEDDLKDDDIYF
jgi:peptide chain release factor subunit 1